MLYSVLLMKLEHNAMATNAERQAKFQEKNRQARQEVERLKELLTSTLAELARVEEERDQLRRELTRMQRNGKGNNVTDGKEK